MQCVTTLQKINTFKESLDSVLKPPSTGNSEGRLNLQKGCETASGTYRNLMQGRGKKKGEVTEDKPIPAHVFRCTDVLYLITALNSFGILPQLQIAHGQVEEGCQQEGFRSFRLPF